MEVAAQQWWASSQQACPSCGGTGVPVVLEINDAETMEAVRSQLACLGECCFDGSRGIDRECIGCGAQWNSGAPSVVVG